MLQALARWLDDARHVGVNILGNMGLATGVAGLEAATSCVTETLITVISK
jgi:hypothetical protein